VRALLIVNPHATSTTRQRRDVIARALASAVDLEVVQTRYRGDATRLAAAAAADKFGLVMTLGGDGTVNEAVNGMLGGAGSLGEADSAGAAGPGSAEFQAGPVLRAGAGVQSSAARPHDRPAATSGSLADHGADVTERADVQPPDAADLPALAALPGGNANVFTRSLGLPADPVDAAGRLIEDLAAGNERCIGLGTANGRYFTFNAGLGLDAETVRAVEGRRATGRSLSPAMFARTALRQYYRVTDRRHPAITVVAPEGLTPDPVFLCIVSNSAPWTYLGRRAVTTNPAASFETGLDLMALRSLGTVAMARTLRQMLADRTEPPRGRSVVSGHDLAKIELRADRPVACQLDGEYVGELEHVQFRSVPRALRVIGLPESAASAQDVRPGIKALHGSLMS
jgi:diacylglycerol kinase family enzyme